MYILTQETVHCVLIILLTLASRASEQWQKKYKCQSKNQNKVQLANAQVQIRTRVAVARKGTRGDNSSDTKYCSGAGLAVSLSLRDKGNRQKLISFLLLILEESK